MCAYVCIPYLGLGGGHYPVWLNRDVPPVRMVFEEKFPKNFSGNNVFFVPVEAISE